MDATLRNRVVAGVACLGAAVLGVHLASQVEFRSNLKIEEISKQEVSARAAQQDALERELNFKSATEYYAVRVREDAEEHGLAAVSMEDLRAPTEYFDELKKPVVLHPGKRWSSKHLSVRASTEKVRFQQRGAMIAARHSVATVKNISDSPIAYFVDIGPADERDCRARGARMHNAMALLPGETAEIAVCAGTGSVRLSAAKVLEITALGYIYFSRLPPVAVGHDAVTSQAHRPVQKTPLCTQAPTVRIADWIQSEQLSWADVADFYARHACDKYQVPVDYRRATKPLETLPVVSPTGTAP